eukprot:755924-Hanusia_phi.AAC.2
MAGQRRKGVVDHVDHGVADRALFHPLEHLVHVLLPQQYRVQQRPVLVVQQRPHRQRPLLPLPLADPDPPRALHLHHPQRVKLRHAEDHFHDGLVLAVGRGDLPRALRRPDGELVLVDARAADDGDLTREEDGADLVGHEALDGESSCSVELVVPHADEGREGLEGLEEEVSCQALHDGDAELRGEETVEGRESLAHHVRRAPAGGRVEGEVSEGDVEEGMEHGGLPQPRGDVRLVAGGAASPEVEREFPGKHAAERDR